MFLVTATTTKTTTTKDDDKSSRVKKREDVARRRVGQDDDDDDDKHKLHTVRVKVKAERKARTGERVVNVASVTASLSTYKDGYDL